VAQQHDRDEGGQLPPEVQAEPAELVAAEAPKATEMAMAISSIIPGWRDRASAKPPVRKGHPP
jgi:hypothetical protein